MSKKRASFLVTFAFVLTGWGFCMGRYEVFPFPVVQSMKLYLFPFQSKHESIVAERSGSSSDITEISSWRSAVSHFRNLDSAPGVLMLGDSITAAGEWHEIFADKKIANRGIAGDTTAGILERLDEVLAKNPKAVFVLAGINDLANGRDVDAVFEDYKKIVQSLRDSDIEVFVQSTIIPGLDKAEYRRRQVKALNRKLRDYCITKNVQFVDLNETLAKDGALAPEYTFDGIHLNGDGYERWATMIARYVEQVRL